MIGPLPERDIVAAAQRAAALCLDQRATDVVILDLRAVTDMTDFFVIASGTSDTHVKSVAEHVLSGLKHGEREDPVRGAAVKGTVAHHVEGMAQGRWVLLDYVDFVVHIFHPVLRDFYQLERLWGDAEIMPVAAALR